MVHFDEDGYCIGEIGATQPFWLMSLRVDFQKLRRAVRGKSDHFHFITPISYSTARPARSAEFDRADMVRDRSLNERASHFVFLNVATYVLSIYGIGLED